MPYACLANSKCAILFPCLPTCENLTLWKWWSRCTRVPSFTNNARDTNYFIKNFTNWWCGEWLLVNEKNDINSRPRWKPIKG